MIHTNARHSVFDVTFIPNEHSEPETDRLADDQFDEDLDVAAQQILDEYEPRAEVLTIHHIPNEPNERFPSGRQLYGNRRYE